MLRCFTHLFPVPQRYYFLWGTTKPDNQNNKVKKRTAMEKRVEWLNATTAISNYKQISTDSLWFSLKTPEKFHLYNF